MELSSAELTEVIKVALERYKDKRFWRATYDNGKVQFWDGPEPMVPSAGKEEHKSYDPYTDPQSLLNPRNPVSPYNPVSPLNPMSPWHW